ncbi:MULTISPECIES: hypothetical protein [Furfurilactobacillus]|uniref:hypothetical protein n=1 Tax=Furfurilactobacillus TaxID=2767882 RepID=UPI00338ED38C
MNKVRKYGGDTPVCFQNGVKNSSVSPTAIDKQNFPITRSEKSLTIKNFGISNNRNLGIIKYHKSFTVSNCQYEKSTV